MSRYPTCSTNLDLVVTVVMQDENSIELRVSCDDQIRRVLDALRQRLASILLHLDVVEFSVKKTKNYEIYIIV